MQAKTATYLTFSLLMVGFLTLNSSAQTNNVIATNSQSSSLNCQKEAYTDLQQMNPRKAILDLMPLYAHDVRLSLTQANNAKKAARDLAWIGRALLFDENEIAAVSVLSMAHRLAPDDLAITASLIDNCSRAGYPERAAALIAECKNKQDLELIKVQAMIALRETAPLKARKLLEEYALDPALSKNAANDAGFAITKARCTLRNGLQEAAVKQFKEAAQVNNNRYVSLLWKAAALALEEKPGEQELGEQNRLERIKILKEAGTIVEGDPVWHNDLAIAYGHHDHSAAKEQAKLALHSKRFTSRSYYTMSFDLQNEQKYELSEKYIEHVIKLRPRSAEAQFSLSRPLRRQKKLDQAIAAIKKGLTFNPKAGSARVDLINLLIEQKKDDEAFKEIQTMNQLCPEFIGGWRKLGDAYRKQKRWTESLAAYQKALSLVSNKYDDLNVLAKNEIGQIHAGMGFIYYAQEDKSKALEEAKIFNSLKFIVHLANGLQLLNLRPDHIVLSQLKKEREIQEHILLGDMLFETKSYSESLSEYKEAEKINDDDADLHTYILNVCVESGQWQDAIHEDLSLSQVLVKSAPAKLGEFFKKQFAH
ncbi:MAG: tetratricopeptide repeat protein [Candidatus Obscuribacterales bacterium]|nr:tetratricopeptide repeat protein [Candidatus Obscuribacterales bacterium]